MEIEGRRKFFSFYTSATRTQKVLTILIFFDLLLVGFAGFSFLSKKLILDEQAFSGEQIQQVTQAPSTPVPSPSILPTLTPTPSVQKTLTPARVLTPASTQTPTPAPDTTAPQVVGFVGLDEGATVSYSTSCIPVQLQDNISPFSTLMSRFKLDANEWTSWGYDAEYCLPNMGDGPHVLSVEVRDQAGNVGSATRNFTVQKS